MQRRSRARRFLRKVRPFEHAHHLQDADTAGTRRWRGDHGIAAITAGQRRALNDAVVLQIVKRDGSAVGLHVGCKQSCCLAFVEVFRALIANALQDLGKLGLNQKLAGLKELSVMQKNAL